MYKSGKKIATKFKRCFAKHKSTTLVSTHKTIYNAQNEKLYKKCKVTYKVQCNTIQKTQNFYTKLKNVIVLTKKSTIT
jgi:hypothetical protein